MEKAGQVLAVEAESNDVLTFTTDQTLFFPDAVSAWKCGRGMIYVVNALHEIRLAAALEVEPTLLSRFHFSVSKSKLAHANTKTF